MSHSKIIVFVLIASLLTQGCSATVYLKPTADSPETPATAREVDGRILKNEGGILYVDDGDEILEIPTDLVEDIDHTGAAVGIAGGVMAVSGLGFYAWALQADEEQLGLALTLGLLGVGMMIIGLPIGIGGAIGYSQSKSASEERVEKRDSLEQLSVAPSPFTAPSARGLGLTINF